ncbi:hypothetical protein HMPREF9080_02762 [Cardiobacterium valvarum F0432]|uniref:Uncharacterized protein n=1 Tax=Cardiobacterium valvarum F0432 TaxID=797473 RepID=G9ZIZ5_9GAMM|nr:hypothetical protein HMPREF9080_02762 [Cardiobacterium valvarum F0432]
MEIAFLVMFSGGHNSAFSQAILRILQGKAGKTDYIMLDDL